MKVHFEKKTKYIFSAQILMILSNDEVNLTSLWGLLLAYEGDFGVILGPPWGHSGHIDVDLHA